MVQPTASVRSPEQQLEDFMVTAHGATPAKVEFAKRWAKKESERRAREQADAIREHEARLKDKRGEVDERLGAVTQESNQLYDTIRRHDHEDLKQLFKVARDLRQRVASLESVVAGLEESEQRLRAAKSDPNWFRAFYEKWPTLAAQLPRLDWALADFDADPRRHLPK